VEKRKDAIEIKETKCENSKKSFLLFSNGTKLSIERIIKAGEKQKEEAEKLKKKIEKQLNVKGRIDELIETNKILRLDVERLEQIKKEIIEREEKSRRMLEAAERVYDLSEKFDKEIKEDIKEIKEIKKDIPQLRSNLDTSVKDINEVLDRSVKETDKFYGDTLGEMKREHKEVNEELNNNGFRIRKEFEEEAKSINFAIEEKIKEFEKLKTDKTNEVLNSFDFLIMSSLKRLEKISKSFESGLLKEKMGINRDIDTKSEESTAIFNKTKEVLLEIEKKESEGLFDTTENNLAQIESNLIQMKNEIEKLFEEEGIKSLPEDKREIAKKIKGDFLSADAVKKTVKRKVIIAVLATIAAISSLFYGVNSLKSSNFIKNIKANFIKNIQAPKKVTETKTVAIPVTVEKPKEPEKKSVAEKIVMKDSIMRDYQQIINKYKALGQEYGLEEQTNQIISILSESRYNKEKLRKIIEIIKEVEKYCKLYNVENKAVEVSTILNMLEDKDLLENKDILENKE